MNSKDALPPSSNGSVQVSITMPDGTPMPFAESLVASLLERERQGISEFRLGEWVAPLEQDMLRKLRDSGFAAGMAPDSLGTAIDDLYGTVLYAAAAAEAGRFKVPLSVHDAPTPSEAANHYGMLLLVASIEHFRRRGVMRVTGTIRMTAPENERAMLWNAILAIAPPLESLEKRFH